MGPIRRGPYSTTDVPREMADSFLTAFASVFSTSLPDTPAQHQRCPPGAELDNIEFSPDEVKAVLCALDPHSAMGPDGFHPQLLKACAEALARPFLGHDIFTRSLRECSLPVEWKTSLVIPIF